MSTTNYPQLSQFLGAYFHQDWTTEADTPQAVVKSFRSKASAKKLADVGREIDALLAEGLKEPQLAKRLLKLGCYYDPAGDGDTAVAWLKWLKGALEKPKPKA